MHGYRPRSPAARDYGKHSSTSRGATTIASPQPQQPLSRIPTDQLSRAASMETYYQNERRSASAAGEYGNTRGSGQNQQYYSTLAEGETGRTLRRQTSCDDSFTSGDYSGNRSSDPQLYSSHASSSRISHPSSINSHSYQQASPYPASSSASYPNHHPSSPYPSSLGNTSLDPHHPSNTAAVAVALELPRSRSDQMVSSLSSMSISMSDRSHSQPSYGTQSLCMSHPDLQTLSVMHEAAQRSGIEARVAWAKQVLKFVERHQSTSAASSSKIDDPLLVAHTYAALSYILESSASSTPVPLALYLRADLAASGAFPSYVPSNQHAAFRDFERAANAGYARAWYRIGRAYEDFDDHDRARDAFDQGRRKGSPACEYRCGKEACIEGSGREREGREMLERAARNAVDEEEAICPFVWGMLLAGEVQGASIDGRGGIDVARAKEWIERSAYLDFGPAQYKLGLSYEYAQLGCEFSPLLSVQYYALASQHGNEPEADLALSKWYLCGSSDFDKNEGLAVTFAEKAAAKGLPGAEFAMGYYRELGIGGRQDVEQAKRWYESASAAGNVDAAERLALLHQSEHNVLNRRDFQVHQSQLVRQRTIAQTISKQGRRESIGTSQEVDMRRIATRRTVEQAARMHEHGRPTPPPPRHSSKQMSHPSPASPPRLPPRQMESTQPHLQQPTYHTSLPPPRQRTPAISSSNQYQYQYQYQHQSSQQQQYRASSPPAASLPALRSNQSSYSLHGSPVPHVQLPHQSSPPTSSRSRTPSANESAWARSGEQRMSDADRGGVGLGRDSESVIPAKKQTVAYESFGAMGIRTQGAKKEECCVM